MSNSICKAQISSNSFLSILFGSILLCSNFLYAANDVVLGLDLLRTAQKRSGDSFSSSTEVTQLFSDLILGLKMEPLYLGLIYSSYEETYSSGTSSTPIRRTATGASIGYVNAGLYLTGHYFVQANETYNVNLSLTGGSGWGADFGYRWMMSNAFYITAKISQKTYNFTKVELGPLRQNLNNQVTSLVPMVGLGFIF